MWVSRHRFEAMEKKIHELERRVQEYSELVQFRVYEEPLMFPCYREPHFISAKDVLASVLYKLGMELKYVRGQPSRVAVQDASHAASNSHTEEKP